MCGIYATNISINKERVGDRLKEIEFRGPDNMNVVQIDDLILGHLRLAVIDIDQRSNQPMSFDHLHIIFNGEIYNFEVIKKKLLSLGHTFITNSDTEVLLHGYIEYGHELPRKLNGMFSFCIYDSVKRELFCARDRLGVKPFYYFWKNGKFEVCSQLVPIKYNKVISNEAISIYLDCGYI